MRHFEHVKFYLDNAGDDAIIFDENGSVAKRTTFCNSLLTLLWDGKISSPSIKTSHEGFAYYRVTISSRDRSKIDALLAELIMWNPVLLKYDIQAVAY